MPPSRPSCVAGRLAKHARPAPSRAWVVDIPFEWRAWASTQGVAWDAASQASVWRGEELPAPLLPFAARPFSWEWRQQRLLSPGAPQPIPRVLPAWQARPHQKVASGLVAKAYHAGRVGFLLADEVGVGKTMSAWDFVLSQAPLRKVLIVTTSSAVAHWRNTLLHAGHEGKDVLILNYERLGRVFDVSGKTLSSRAKGKRKRIATNGTPESFDLIVFDESHKGKNLASARSVMMRRLTSKARFVLWASATAGQNPLELAYLAPLLAQVTGARVSELTTDFEAWCKSQDIGVSRGKYGRWEWRKSTRSLDKVRAWLFDGDLPAAIRRLPQQITGWRALERQLTPVALDAQARMDYQAAWEAFRRDRIQEGATSVREQGTKRARKGAANGLVAQLRFRQKSSWLRISSTLEMVADHLDNGRRVAISLAFHDSMNEMARQLREAGIDPAMIHGKLSPAAKEAERLRFQKGQTPVVLFTVEEAISLHEGEYEDVPRTLLVHDLRWSALLMSQVDGRCHRDGKFAPSVWLFAEGTVEEDIARVLLDRVIAMKSMHGDDTSDLQALEDLLARKLAA